MRRKLSAVLMADVVGYSRLMEQDEADTHAALSALREDLIRPSILAHHGEIIRLMGDGMLVDFASAVDAVECAVEVQQRAPESGQASRAHEGIVLRIGINVGDIIIEENDIYGDGVNVAARLEAIAPPGGILISEQVYDQVSRNVPIVFRDLGPVRVKNISRPVRVYMADLGRSYDDWVIDRGSLDSPASEASVLPERPVIAVLPFDNLSAEPDRQYFIDGFVDDLITDLSRFQTLSVIARTSSFVFRGEGHSLKAVARQLGAQYILEGSVREMGGRIRIATQLIECESGSHLWAERYDRSLEEIFDVQDEVISQIVATLESRLIQDRLEAAKRLPPKNLKAYDYWLRGNKLMEDWTAESDQAAIQVFQEAIDLDPEFARAYTSLAGIYNSRNLLAPGNPTDVEDRARGLEYARKSVLLDADDARNHTNLAWSYMRVRDFVQAERHFELARQLNPNDPSILISRAIGAAFIGDPEAGLKIAKKAIQVNPIHPDYYLGFLAACYFLAERYEDSIEAIQQAPTVWPLIWGWCAAAYGQIGLTEEARRAADKFIHDVKGQWVGTADPSNADFVDWFFDVNPIRRESDIDRIIQGLKRAGLPEPRSRVASPI